jgi:hypothetical protein
VAERAAIVARSASFEVARGAFSREKEPLKPEAQAKVIESQVFPSLALQASIAIDFSQQAQLQKAQARVGATAPCGTQSL